MALFLGSDEHTVKNVALNLLAWLSSFRKDLRLRGPNSSITCLQERSHGTFCKKSWVILAQIQIQWSDDLYFLCSMSGRHYGFIFFKTRSLPSAQQNGLLQINWWGGGKNRHRPTCGSSEQNEQCGLKQEAEPCHQNLPCLSLNRSLTMTVNLYIF